VANLRRDCAMWSIFVYRLYLAGIFWLDRAVPQLMTKAFIFIPVVGVGFAIESITMQPLIDRFKPSEAG
jgi:hypothetical protein